MCVMVLCFLLTYNIPMPIFNTFKITDPATWNKATNKPITWNGLMLYDKDKKPITERSLTDLFNTVWAFLEKKNPLSAEQKEKSIRTMLDKMIAAGQTDPKWADNEKKPEPKGKFDPRNTTTYQYADYDKRLIIDGIPIYRYERNKADKFIKAPVDEGNFASNLEFMIKYVPDYQLKNGYQAYLNDCIQWEADRCNENRKENIIGGYLFTDAMVELCEGCSDGQKEKIGKIMVEYRKGGMRTSRLKQLLFDEYTGVDNYFFTDIARAADFKEEQDLMLDYFCGLEFDTEEEKFEYFNSSGYLKKHPRLKAYLISG
jgi:hypothetical protein